jgi:quercetin dioxygenase-like cupin family protein
MQNTITLFALRIAALTLATLPLASLALDPGPAVQSTLVLKTTQSWDGTPLTYPQGTPEITGMVITVAPGAQTGWHQHPVPSFALILEGELEVQLKDGRKHRIQAGEALAEVVNTLHNGRNPGATPIKLVVFYAGVQKVPLSIAQDKP